MSDLQCPATVVFARHGAAAYESTTWADEGGSLTPTGRAQAADLAGRLLDRRISHVYCSTMARAVQTAEIAASVLDVGVTTRISLQEFAVGDFAGVELATDPFAATYAAWLAGELPARVSGGESGSEVIDRFVRVVGEIADVHRGETVLVVSHGGILRLGIPALARMAAGVEPARFDNCSTAEVAIDADGAVCRRWDRPTPRDHTPAS